jgi:hypothetical protein
MRNGAKGFYSRIEFQHNVSRMNLFFHVSRWPARKRRVKRFPGTGLQRSIHPAVASSRRAAPGKHGKRNGMEKESRSNLRETMASI